MIAFNNNDTWTILSSIEQSIKNKVEAVGIPLKDWQISINYGVKTGYNKAFIIDSKKRQEILDNCLTEEEREKTDAVIRPILRGKDIKRYGYKWADLWLINTHNGIKNKRERIHIEDYPAIKQHLDKYWDKIKVRADQGDTPYNLRNCAYMDDFAKPKIMYPNMTSTLPFYYDTKGFFQNDKSFMITGNHIAFLCAFLNSKLFKYCFKDNFPSLGEKGREVRKIFFEKIPVIKVSNEVNAIFERAITVIQNSYSNEQSFYIDNMIFDLYDLSCEERKLISYIE